MLITERVGGPRSKRLNTLPVLCAVKYGPCRKVYGGGTR